MVYVAEEYYFSSKISSDQGFVKVNITQGHKNPLADVIITCCMNENKYYLEDHKILV